MYRAKITAASSYLPKKKISNFDLEKKIDTSDEWIVQRTGISNRYIAQEDETVTYMGAQAAKKLNANPDLIIVATSTPDMAIPSAAVQIQKEIDAKNAFAFDMQAACAGFIYALATAQQFIQTGKVGSAVVIGSEVMSRLVDWQDRSTCVLFGDGAGAVLLERSDDDSGIIDFNLFADGQRLDLLYAMPSIKMRGPDLFRHAVNKLGHCIEDILNKNNLATDTIDWFIPHQANLRIIKSLSERFNIPMEKIIVTIQDHANTSAASIPIALDSAIDQGKIKKNDLVLMEAIGAGLVWGSILIRF